MTVGTGTAPSDPRAPPHRAETGQAETEDGEDARFRDFRCTVTDDHLNIHTGDLPTEFIACEKINVVGPIDIGVEGKRAAIEKFHVPGILREVVRPGKGHVIGGVRGFAAGALPGRIVAKGVIAVRLIDRIHGQEIRADPGVEINAQLIAQIAQKQARGAIEIRIDRPFEVPGGRRRRTRCETEPTARGLSRGEAVGAVAVAVECVFRQVRTVEPDLCPKAEFDTVAAVNGKAAIRVAAAEDGVIVPKMALLVTFWSNVTTA